MGRRLRALRRLNAQAMATEVAAQYFAKYDRHRPYEVPRVTQVFLPGQGWRRCLPDYVELSPGMVEHYAKRGARAVLLTAYGHDADFWIRPAGALSPAYLT